MVKIKKYNLVLVISGVVLLISTIGYFTIAKPLSSSDSVIKDIIPQNKTVERLERVDYYPMTKRNIWIDAPVKEPTLEIDEEVKIVGHKIRGTDVKNITVEVNEEEVETISTFAENGVLDYFEYIWKAEVPGKFVIDFILAYTDGTFGESSSVTVYVLESASLETPTSEEKPEMISTPVQPSLSVSEIKEPVIEPDITPLASPRSVSPINNYSFNCVGKVTLVWEAVTNPTGTTNYEIVVEYHWGDNDWKQIVESPLMVRNTQVDIATQCGWYYRWKVRAENNEGKVSPFSSWEYFLVNLM